MMAVKSGRAIRFHEEKVRSTGRGAIGVTGIEVDDATDEVVGMICVNKEDRSKTVLVVSEKGFGKRTALVDEDGEDVYRITNRGGKGVKTLNVTEKTGKLVGLLDVEESEDLLITCKSGITLRTSIASIKQAGRATQGVTLIRLEDGDEIVALSKIKEQVDKEEEEVVESATEGSVENTGTLIDEQKDEADNVQGSEETKIDN